MALVASAILLLLHWQWWQMALFFVAAFFIDVDHYLYFIFRKKSFNLARAYRYFIRLSRQTGRKKVRNLMIFHVIEVPMALLILAFFNFSIFFPVLFGFLVHYSFDCINSLRERKKKYKRHFSLICYLVKSKK